MDQSRQFKSKKSLLRCPNSERALRMVKSDTMQSHLAICFCQALEKSVKVSAVSKALRSGLSIEGLVHLLKKRERSIQTEKSNF